MQRTTALSAILAVVGTVAVLWQSHSISNLRANHPSAGSALRITNSADAAIRQEASALRQQTRDLPRLRNEVSQLRATCAGLGAIRGENARLVEAKRAGSSLPGEAHAGFIAREKLKDAGFATPEATVETFFWAMREGNGERWVQSLSPEHEDRKDFELLSPAERTRPDGSFQYGNNERKKMMERFSDFTVSQQDWASEDFAALTVRSSVNTNVIRFQLQRFGTEWKLNSYPDW